MKPCAECPWLSNQPRDLQAINQPSVRDAALKGSAFMCHTTAGATECTGVKQWRKQQTAKK